MADATYGPLVYRKQGSTEFVVASSGLVTVEDGGKLNVDSGGEIEIDSGGHIDVDGYIDVNSSGGYISHYVSGATSSASGSTTLSTLSNSGLSWITSSGDVRMIYLQAPVEGVEKTIFFTAGTTGTIIYIDAQGVSTGVTFSGMTDTVCTTSRFLIREGTTQSAAQSVIQLVGHSTSKWIVTNASTGIVAADTSS